MGLFQPAMWSFTRPATYNLNWKLQRYISLYIGSLFLDCLTKAQQKLGGGWTNPFEKYARQNGFIFPNFRGENKKCLKTPPRKETSFLRNFHVQHGQALAKPRYLEFLKKNDQTLPPQHALTCTSTWVLNQKQWENPQNGWFISWKTLWTNGWFWG